MKYSLKEITDIAFQIEEICYYFYKKSYEKFSNQNECCKLLNYLAQEELRHRDILEHMLSKINTKEVNLTENYYNYLQSIGYHSIFKTNKDVDKIISNTNNSKDVYNMSLDIEKSVILWYFELLYLYRDEKEATTVLEQLLNDEKKHVISLTECIQNEI